MEEDIFENLKCELELLKRKFKEEKDPVKKELIYDEIMDKEFELEDARSYVYF